ncbi:uncharacterized protein N7477_009316 [Penicillium maclennaniae]|uniref:uncharacterized protein n=1 Tax=Penicillium maclennaniae TaxID=1343394 RepID=UPI0025412B41|nr:uncharacterized protein N7477_009316 [Penicillium maclennaniae]KAJ5661700.1 hypothetical protein N7477_009316 [Penicillium maclennaniae]
MHIKTILFLAWHLASSVIASHIPQEQRCNLPRRPPFSFPSLYTTFQNVQVDHGTEIEQNHLAVDQLPPACNLPACLGLTGTITCIVSAVTSDDEAALQRCISDGLTEVTFIWFPSLVSF